jgi:hypothetical protein
LLISFLVFMAYSWGFSLTWHPVGHRLGVPFAVLAHGQSCTNARKPT